MSVKIEVGAGGIPHNQILIYGLVGSIVLTYLTYLNTITQTQYFAFFGGLAAVAALIWGTDTIKHLCSYGLGTGVPSAGMIALGSGVIAALVGATTGIFAPIVAVIVAAIIGAVAGVLANHVVRMDIPVMIVSLIELAIVGAMTVLGLAAMVGGTFNFTDLVTGTTTFLGFTIQSYEASVIGGSIIAVIFMLAAIAIQHSFNACLGPGEKQDRTLMLAAECGFLSMIPVAIISFAFIAFIPAIISLVISVVGWFYTYAQYIELSKRDAYAWLDAKPILEPKGGA
ncbi:MAG TPA: tetrahydromethanopterin S-methyltransferase subunit C [Methanoculleus sp.]|jgi:tetrahydromethanopterin S-methyltransferase subunit C|uniref:tetrahydromethanopterin S-methyltransferase subunit MtrC n=1 Tax=Methanoculleus sp. TaxID=90427 RepID=UPI000AD3BAF6|nr:tetrahydromethanopterin S-methyltransferase subunit C [Methanoculleus sp.]MBP7144868.1 tetrahydromethanopterin S-methyltransferase subunit C [Methanoculleus sp.]HNV38242.1 tetrahydromethanopterin S-methyltransferase subunit C [Methanoculleus sp.]HOC84472.1 tetrahydromethanopterin S-methyltransferase subunit C [Methanoculleus sp.]HOF95532.1 tetrahydromethanopterin S-methyltransferase subunit C [Methanoculleus sp.]HOS67981.1 tetrahydromethanopterin S-methyltransferase subunit C [Methanoculleu